MPEYIIFSRLGIFMLFIYNVSYLIGIEWSGKNYC